MSRWRISENNRKALALALLSAGLTAGVVLSNLCFQEYIQTVGTVGSALLLQYAKTTTGGWPLFFYLLRVRLGIVLLLLIIGTRSWGAVAALVYCVWIGFSGGLVMAMAVTSGGISELLYLLVMLFPQILVYAPAWCLLYALILQYGDKIMGRRRYRLRALLIAALFFVGVLLEACVNPLLLQRISTAF